MILFDWRKTFMYPPIRRSNIRDQAHHQYDTSYRYSSETWIRSRVAEFALMLWLSLAGFRSSVDLEMMADFFAGMA